ncbi:MAG: hypothetical protein M1819_007217 [Sarea resinae]|nr:MAG: hypothetical protein M1819_007217 [Sarea resinae]
MGNIQSQHHPHLSSSQHHHPHHHSSSERYSISGPSSPATPTASTSTTHSVSAASVIDPGRQRESLQALATCKATAAPPSESHASATAESVVLPKRLSSHSRRRSQQYTNPEKSDAQATVSSMGNEQSRPKADGSGKQSQDPSPSSKPVEVPSSEGSKPDSSSVEPSSAPPADLYRPPTYQSSRPPRLPLPIEEEVHTPGSPILSTADLSGSKTDLSSALDRDAVEGALPRKSSVLSNTTIDDDDIEDGVDAHHYTVDGASRETIPTLVEWKQGGERVYVTGTFANWNRKFRLHKDPNRDGLSAVIQLPPGTHHLKFIVDGEMRTSDDMPTAVDYTNILVNYIEISVDDIPMPTPSKPVDIDQTQQRDKRPPPSGVYPPQVLPTTPDEKPTTPATEDVKPLATPAPTSPTPPAAEPPKIYSSEIPRFLVELDLPEDSPQYQRAAAAVGSLPPPPSLPLFLGKSILNGNTPMKDDSSVLTMPNHTVLNHLATSSIKHNVLATSATTRYKRKYVTTIMYKPTSEDTN